MGLEPILLAIIGVLFGLLSTIGGWVFKRIFSRLDSMEKIVLKMAVKMGVET